MHQSSLMKCSKSRRIVRVNSTCCSARALCFSVLMNHFQNRNKRPVTALDNEVHHNEIANHSATLSVGVDLGKTQVSTEQHLTCARAQNKQHKQYKWITNGKRKCTKKVNVQLIFLFSICHAENVLWSANKSTKTKRTKIKKDCTKEKSIQKTKNQIKKAQHKTKQKHALPF